MRLLLLMMTGFVFLNGSAAMADACTETVRANLAGQGNVVYTEILAEGVKAGRLYSRDAAASGAKRFIREFVARQVLSSQALVSAE